MAVKDFQATQIRTFKIIGSGSEHGQPSILVYSSSKATDYDGSINKSLMLGNVGTDVFMFVSGATSDPSGSNSARNEVTLFGGDLVISGTLFAERSVIEVDLNQTGSLTVSGAIHIANGTNIATIELDEQGSTHDLILVNSASNGNIVFTINSGGTLTEMGTIYGGTASPRTSLLWGLDNTMEGNYSAIGGGYQNKIESNGGSDSTYNVVAGGRGNDIEGATSYAAILGGYNNQITSSQASESLYDIIGGGLGNKIQDSRYATVGGGNINYISSSDYSVIAGGKENLIYGGNDDSNNYYSAILGGFSNGITGSFQGAILAGGYNEIENGDYNVVGSGQYNQISGSGYSGIFAGYKNKILADDSSSPYMKFIGAGYVNRILGDAYGSAIVAGANNTITSSQDHEAHYNIIGAGRYNTINDSEYSAIPAGHTNEISSSDYSAILGGRSNLISAVAGADLSAILGGSGSLITAPGSFTLGSHLTASVANSIHIGGGTGHDYTIALSGSSLLAAGVWDNLTASSMSTNSLTADAVTASNLTSTRVVLAGTDGILEDHSGLIFDSGLQVGGGSVDTLSIEYPNGSSYVTFSRPGGPAEFMAVKNASAGHTGHLIVTSAIGTEFKSGPEAGYELHNLDDCNFYVSGVVGSRGTSTRGTAIFSGDVAVTGALFVAAITSSMDSDTSIEIGGEGNHIKFFAGGGEVASIGSGAGVEVAQFLGHLGDTDTRIYFQDDQISISAGATEFIDITELASGPSTMVINDNSGDIDFRIETNNKTHAIFTDASTDQVLILSGGATGDLVGNAAASTDTNFFVSGTIGARGSTHKGTAVFGGDLVVSGALTDGQGNPIAGAKTASAEGWFSGSAGGGVGTGEGAGWISSSGSLALSGSNLDIAQYIRHVGDTTTKIEFAEDRIRLYADDGTGTARQMLQLDGTPSGAGSPQIMFNGDARDFDFAVVGRETSKISILVSGTYGSTQYPNAGTNDTNLFLSGTQVLILSGGAAASLDPAAGTDVNFFVSGSEGSKDGAVKGTALFGGDLVISGATHAKMGLSGSLTRLVGGTSYLAAGSNVTITSASNGQIVIASALGGSNVGWTGPSAGVILSTGSVGLGSLPKARFQVGDEAGGVTLLIAAGGGSGSGSLGFTQSGTPVAALSRDLDGTFTLVNSSSNKDIVFKGNDGGSLFTAMTIDMSEAGRVGIGTSSPAHALSVVGAVSASLGLSGSLTRLVDGTSYLAAGSNVTVTSSSNGQIVIASTGGGGSSIGWTGPSAGVIATTGSVTMVADKKLTFDGSTSYTEAIWGDATSLHLSSSNQVLILSGATNGPTTPDVATAVDTNFFVSGTLDSKGTAIRGTAVMGGDLVVSGTAHAEQGISGSITRLTDGTSYLAAGSNITVASSSNGQIVITSTAAGTVDGAGAATRLAYWADADTLMSNSGFHFNEYTLGLTGSATGATSAQDVHRIYTGTTSNSSITSHAGAAGILVDYDVTGIVAVDQVQKHKGMWVKYDQSAPTMVGMVQGVGVQIEVTGSDTGVSQTVDGIRVDVADPGTFDNCAARGISVTAPAGWVAGEVNASHIRCHNLATTDYFDISVGADGKTQLTTLDSAAANAHLNLKPDGIVTILSGGAAASPNETNATDIGFFVSGTVGSKDSAVAGTALFGGDTVVSGTLVANRSDDGANAAIKIDKDYTGTTTVGNYTTDASGLLIDYDVTGIVATGQTAIHDALAINYNQDSPTMVGTIEATGADIRMTGGTSGTQSMKGMAITLAGADTNVGIDVTAPNDSTHFIARSSDSILDYFKISVGESGATIVSTNDAGAAVADLTLDVDGDIVLDADGGQVTIKDAGANHFLFDCDNTSFTIYDDTDDSDLFKIQVAANGATTISTTDDGAAAADLTVDIDGDIIFDADGGNWSFDDGGSRQLDITGSSGDVVISVPTEDKDLTFKVNSGSTTTTALNIDGSTGGVRAGAVLGGMATAKIAFEVNYGNAGADTGLSENQGGGEIVTFGGFTGSGWKKGSLRFLHTDGEWLATTGSAVATGGSQMLGIALGNSGPSEGVLIRGFFNAKDAPGSAFSPGYLSGSFAVGQPVYVGSGSAEYIQSGAPSKSGAFVRIIGYGTPTANIVYFDPDKTWIENS